MSAAPLTPEEEEFREQADEIFDELTARIGESRPQPRLQPTRRVAELLGDPQRAYPVVHVTGTNGKTSTSRMIESLLRAHGLHTGLLTSPHFARVNERFVLDGEPVSDERFVANYRDIEPYLAMVDRELEAADEAPLSYFEALTALAFAIFADAPVDVAVLEVGMGGEWDSTNVADGQVAVFTPIDLDHVGLLGDTIEEIARTKSGIIKPTARVVSSAQAPGVLAVLRQATELSEGSIVVEGDEFAVASDAVAVGGQLVGVRGVAGVYEEEFLPLFGAHQAQNAAVAIAAVEQFLGGGTQPLTGDVIAEGFGQVTSPGRLELVGIEPSVLVDGAHNPHGARALTAALTTSFDFDEIAIVLAVLDGKDATGIVDALVPVASRVIVTHSSSERQQDVDALAELVEERAPGLEVDRQPFPSDAFAAARGWATQAPKRAVLVAGSLTIVGDAIAAAEAEGWK